jgi:uncharacterized protein GlcG (DUF336 family)
MKLSGRRSLITFTSAAAALVLGGLAIHRSTAVAQGATQGAGPAPAQADVTRILDQGVAQSAIQPSAFRPSATTRMHIAVVDRAGNLVGFRSMDDAWEASKDIAIAKARTAAFLSSNQNALTSRTIGVASQAHGPGGAGDAGPLWGIGESNEPGITGGPEVRNGLITFPGGLPLYQNGVLVGGVGVSGDSVDADEAVAIAAARGFEPAAAIRVDTVIPGLPYTTATPFTPTSPAP